MSKKKTNPSHSVDPYAAKRGRPRLDEDEVKRSVTLRLNVQEREEIELAAKDMSLTVTAWMRWVMRVAAKKQAKQQK